LFLFQPQKFLAHDHAHRYQAPMSYYPLVIRTGAIVLLAPLLFTFSGCLQARHSLPPPPPSTTPSIVKTTVEPVILIQASSSVSDPAERNYYRRMAAKLADWLRDSGIPVTLVDDKDAARSIGRQTRIVILYSTQSLDSGTFKQLSRFAKHGGKLVVFHAADSNLASLMGVKLSPRILATRPGQWSAFRFTSSTPLGTPSRIEQDSLGLRPIYPVSTSTKVIAWWENSSGTRAPEPAWVQSEHGFWMSHMLQEGDVPAKKQMLIALLGSCDPAIRKVAAEKALLTAGTLHRFPDARQALSAIENLASRPDAKFNSVLTQAGTLHSELVRQYRTGQYDQVITTARLLDSAVMEAYARTASPRRGEFRGVWNHSGTGLYPGNWEGTCRILSDSGITDIFPHVQRPWNAHYASRFLSPSTTTATLGDQLATCLPAARRHNLNVHAWIICWNMDGAPAPLLANYRREGRLQVSSKGESVDWLCPSDPLNRAFQLDCIREVATRFPVAGIHLDYIRYPSKDSCFCQGCRQRFSRDTGISIKRWPANVQSGPHAAAFQRWRRNQITQWLADTHQELKRIAPAIQLSVAVYPGYPSCKDSIGQDWGEWARRDLVDFICPMNYTVKTSQFKEWINNQAAFPGVREKLLPGIGVTANESRLDAASVIDQISTLRRQSLPGFLLFDANRTLEKDVLPYLQMGITSTP
jgi:uncharacterized lipoprotein YddW (UPF0748 family)